MMTTTLSSIRSSDNSFVFLYRCRRDAAPGLRSRSRDEVVIQFSACCPLLLLGVVLLRDSSTVDALLDGTLAGWRATSTPRNEVEPGAPGTRGTFRGRGQRKEKQSLPRRKQKLLGPVRRYTHARLRSGHWNAGCRLPVLTNEHVIGGGGRHNPICPSGGKPSICCCRCCGC